MTARDAFLTNEFRETDVARAIDAQAAHSAHLNWLEDEAISILREVFGAFERPAILCSCGKDSLVVLHLAMKAAAPGKLPLPIVHIDTGHNFPEVISFREELVARHGLKLIVGHLDDSIRRGTIRLAHPLESRNRHQTVTLLETIEANRFDAVVGGARRDEEKARAKERVFSHRDSFGQWQPRAQRPELWNLYNTQLAPNEHFRVFPISNWTELDVWNYIAREDIALPSIYYTHRREVVERNGLLVPVTDITPPKEGETVVARDVRFRTVGDISCTCPVASTAANAHDVVLETIAATNSERGATRMDDRANDAAMERRKKEGYF
jgi:sulfate adenylyltransferase subunit 2